jgi:long-subunit fatty acid transport protein
VQYSPIWNRKRVLTLGATYDMGGDLKPKVTNKVSVNGVFESVAKNETEYLELVLPHQLTVGAFYETMKFALSVDYTYQNWGERNSDVEISAGGFEVAYCNTHKIKAGVEWTPNRNDVRNFFKRWHYRLGFNYGDYHQTFGGKRVDQYAITFGFGIPVKFGGFSEIDFGVEYGSRGSHDMINERVGLVKQDYVKFAISFSLFGEDYWFVRPKFD